MEATTTEVKPVYFFPAMAGKDGYCTDCGRVIKKYGHYYQRLSDHVAVCLRCAKTTPGAVSRKNGVERPIYKAAA